MTFAFFAIEVTFCFCIRESKKNCSSEFVLVSLGFQTDLFELVGSPIGAESLATVCAFVSRIFIPTNWYVRAIFLFQYEYAGNIYLKCARESVFVDFKQLQVPFIMPICLTILLQRLRENPDFLCNCGCQINLDTEFIQPQTSIGIKSMLEILCERPEFICYCTGCMIPNEYIDTTFGRNSELIETRALIFLNRLIENLQNQPDFLCNCWCREPATDFIRSLTLEPSVKIVAELVCELRPEYVCSCFGCEAHMCERAEIAIPINDDDDEAVTSQYARAPTTAICAHNSQPVGTIALIGLNAFIGILRNRPVLKSLTGALWKLRWIFMVLTAAAMFFIFMKNNSDNGTTESNVQSTWISSTTYGTRFFYFFLYRAEK